MVCLLRGPGESEDSARCPDARGHPCRPRARGRGNCRTHLPPTSRRGILHQTGHRRSYPDACSACESITQAASLAPNVVTRNLQLTRPTNQEKIGDSIQVVEPKYRQQGLAIRIAE